LAAPATTAINALPALAAGVGVGLLLRHLQVVVSGHHTQQEARGVLHEDAGGAATALMGAEAFAGLVMQAGGHRERRNAPNTTPPELSGENAR
ncbi:hypothetical protein JYK22_41570, partial [Nonomuraea sp. RK-328]|nr:hypothetical protein [Nonomuraea sp. RK-328]